MACKNNKKNRRRVAFYGINKFDYETREKLMKGCPPPEETPIEKDKEVKSSPENEWAEV